MSQPTELFALSNLPSRNAALGAEPIRGFLFRLLSGRQFLLPVHEITGVSLLPLERDGCCVEIQARHHLIRLAMDDKEGGSKLINFFQCGAINEINEGTAPLSRGQSKLTLVIEIIDLNRQERNGGEPGSPPQPHPVAPASAPRVGLGFPSL